MVAEKKNKWAGETIESLEQTLKVIIRKKGDLSNPLAKEVYDELQVRYKNEK